MDVKKILEEATIKEASDIFIIAGRPLSYKTQGVMKTLNEIIMYAKETFEFITSIYSLAERDISGFEQSGDDMFSFTLPEVSRYRVSTFKQQGAYSAVIRVFPFSLPDTQALHIPDSVMNLASARQGMILVTGLAGSGKSTTLACMIDKINCEQEKHIITLENPLEYLHQHQKSIVSQREIGSDTKNYVTALKSTLLQSPDVIMLDEMPDYETISAAVTAAETGYLVFSSLHTVGTSNSIERMVRTFPTAMQPQILEQLASSLLAVISQKTLPSISGEIVPAFEVVILTPSIRSLIREGKIDQIDDAIETSLSETMMSMDYDIYRLYKEGIIDKNTAVSEALRPERMAKRLQKEQP